MITRAHGRADMEDIGGENAEPADYWDFVGIDPTEVVVEGVADRDLPDGALTADD